MQRSFYRSAQHHQQPRVLADFERLAFLAGALGSRFHDVSEGGLAAALHITRDLRVLISQIQCVVKDSPATQRSPCFVFVPWAETPWSTFSVCSCQASRMPSTSARSPVTTYDGIARGSGPLPRPESNYILFVTRGFKCPVGEALLQCVERVPECSVQSRETTSRPGRWK